MFPQPEITLALIKEVAHHAVRSNGDVFKAAMKVCGGVHQDAVYIKDACVNHVGWDEYYGEAEAVYDPLAELPTKADLAREIFAIVKDKQQPAKERIAAGKLYGDVMGFIEKPKDAAPMIDNSRTTNVLVVEGHGSDDDWEKKLAAQQQALKAAANAEPRTVN